MTVKTNYGPLTYTIFTVAEDQYNVIISSPDAWLMADEGAPDEDDISTPEARTTNSARKVKALTQGITGKGYYILVVI